MRGASVGLAPSPELPAQLRPAAHCLPAGVLEEPRAGLDRGWQGGSAASALMNTGPGSLGPAVFVSRGHLWPTTPYPICTISPTPVHPLKGISWTITLLQAPACCFRDVPLRLYSNCLGLVRTSSQGLVRPRVLHVQPAPGGHLCCWPQTTPSLARV